MNPVKNTYQHNSIILCTFILNKSFGQLLEISSSKDVFKKINFFNWHFSYIAIYGKWFTDQNSKSIKIEGNINLTAVISWFE